MSKSLAQTPEKGIWIKSTKGRQVRRVTLPASAVQALRANRECQQTNRNKWGDVYRADLDFGIADEKGDCLNPDSVTAKVSLLTRQLGMPKVRLCTH